MLRILVGYGAALVVLLGLDMLWLKFSFASVYSPVLGPLMAPHTRIAPVAAFYLIYPIGIMLFAVGPAFAENDYSAALLRGALFGFFAYLTYDLTNFGLLKGWTLSVSLIDIAWGTILSGASATAGYMIATVIAGRSS
jgi:uncharacterized membrane protein